MLDIKYDRLADVYALVVDVTANATAEKAIPIPFACVVIDVIVEARATEGNGTLTLKKGSTAGTDAIACAVDTAIARAATINDAVSTFAEGDTVTVDAANAVDR